MTADTTSSSGPMSCDRVTRERVAEDYLLNRLSDHGREAFERHYFECARCFEELRTLEAIGDGLRRSPVSQVAARRPARRWLPAVGVAAVLVLAMVTVLWRQAPPGTAPSSANPTPVVQAPQTPPGDNPLPPAAPSPSLEQLARVDPAPYDPGTFRSAPDASAARFQQGMERYREADYRAAISDLEVAAMLEPDAPHIRFFLGVSQLLSGDTDNAIGSLRAVVGLGDTPYLEESHFYLSKAFLRRRDLAAARAEARQVVALDGPHRAEARRLLDQMEGVELP